MRRSKQDRWVTIIAISCENRALLPFWKQIESELRLIVSKVGWEHAPYRRKLEEIRDNLEYISGHTPDYRNAPGDSISAKRATASPSARRRARARAKSAGALPPAPADTPQPRDD